MHSASVECILRYLLVAIGHEIVVWNVNRNEKPMFKTESALPAFRESDLKADIQLWNFISG